MNIYYFSRTNRSKNIAIELSINNNSKTCFIDDHHDWSGKLGYLKAGAMAAKKELLPITYNSLNKEDEIILVFPVWAGTIPPAIRQFINENQNTKITAVVTSAFSSLKDHDKNLFTNIYEVKGKETKAPIQLIKKP